MRGLKVIVNVTSAGAHGLKSGASGYQGSKNALLRFTEFLNVEYGGEKGEGLVCYCVHPCGTRTELGMNMPEDMHFGMCHFFASLLPAFNFLVYSPFRDWNAGSKVGFC